MDPASVTELYLQKARTDAYRRAQRLPSMLPRVVETFVVIQDLERAMASTRERGKRYRSASTENLFDAARVCRTFRGVEASIPYR